MNASAALRSAADHWWSMSRRDRTIIRDAGIMQEICEDLRRRADELEESTMPGFRPGLEEALHAVRTGSGIEYRDVRRCSLCVIIDHALPGEARDALVASAAGRISGRALHRALREVGFRISLEVILTHRNEAHQP